MDDVTGGQDEPKRPVVSRRRGLGKGLGAILPSPERDDDERSRPDQLTGLPNRSALDERFEEAMARCREDDAALAVLVVALDGFGEVNELYGHSAGDDLLHEAAVRLSGGRRKSDTVARFAGDEFVLVCPYVATTDLACQMATRILEDLSRPTTVDKVELQLSASIGVVVTSPQDTPEERCPRSRRFSGTPSLAMRRAKDEGGGVVEALRPLDARRRRRPRSQNRQDLRGGPRRRRARPRLRGHRRPRHRGGDRGVGDVGMEPTGARGRAAPGASRPGRRGGPGGAGGSVGPRPDALGPERPALAGRPCPSTSGCG